MSRKRRGRGEGSVHERKDGRWSASLSLGYDGSGKRKRKTVYGATKREVQEQLDRLRAEARVGTLPDAGAVTVGQLLARWLAATKGRTGERTHEERDVLVRVHLAPRIGGVKLSKLTPLHVEGLYAELRTAGVGGWAIRHAADALGVALNHAVRLKLIAASPAAAVPKPKAPKREMVALDHAQARAVRLAAAGTASFALIAAALGSGCRQGELLGLFWKDLDLAAGTLTVRRSLSQTKAGLVLKEPKTAAGRRTVHLPAFAVEALAELRKAALEAGRIAAPVFATRTGGHLCKKNVLRAFRAVVRRANKAVPDGAAAVPERVRFHDLRHTVASLLLSGGQSVKAVSQRLGHSNPALTLRVYAHCLPTDDGRLADALGRLIG